MQRVVLGRMSNASYSPFEKQAVGSTTDMFLHCLPHAACTQDATQMTAIKTKTIMHGHTSQKDNNMTL
eukprot:561025-Amphidinium_carterae.1